MRVSIFLIFIHVFSSRSEAANFLQAGPASAFMSDDVRVLLGKEDSLCLYNLQTEETDCSKTDPSGIQVLDYHFTTSTVFYKSNGHGIKRIKLPLREQNETRLEIPSYKDVTSMAVDWVHNNLYLNYKNNRLVKTGIRGENPESIITSEHIEKLITKPAGATLYITNVQLDPYERLIFIKTIISLNGKETSGLILRSDTNGTTPVTIYNSENPSLVNFTLEVGEKKLYIKEGSKIHICTYEGTITKTFTLKLPYGMKDSGLFHVVLNSSYSLSSNPDEPGFSHVLRGKFKYDSTTPIITQPFQPSFGPVTSLKVYDVRLQRQMKNGDYLCEMDCEDKCVVLPPEGDSCFHSVFIQNDTLLDECGRSNLTTSSEMTVIVNGTISDKADFPWHAILYMKTKPNNYWNASCGGTLITRRLVLTAAHCVSVQNGSMKPPKMNVEDLMVGLGKVYRLWEIKEEYEERKKVIEIHTHWLYGGQAFNHANDIAILKLENRVRTNNFVMPACLDLTLKYVTELRTNKKLEGYVAGMGNTVDCVSWGQVCNTYPSDKLLYYKGGIVTNDDCFNISMKIQPSSFTTLTNDRFCVGDGKGSPTQKGDSGGGMTFVFGGLHYVYGIVSNLMLNQKERKTTFTSFTNVSDHIGWVQSHVIQ